MEVRAEAKLGTGIEIVANPGNEKAKERRVCIGYDKIALSLGVFRPIEWAGLRQLMERPSPFADQ